VARTEGTGAQRRAHWSMASVHSGAWKLVGGGTTESGEHGELVSGLTRPRAAAWRPSDDKEMAEERKLGNSGARALEEGTVRWGRCGDLRGRGGQFIGPEEGAPRR
jgi:hypothetical protein